MRAILIVPGEADAVAAAMASGVHALIVDVSGGVLPACMRGERKGGPLLYLRTADLDRDLPAMMAARPHGIVLAPVEEASALARLGTRLTVQEAIEGIGDGATRILAVVATARGALCLPTLPGSSRRLGAIAWDEAALRAEIGAPASRDAAGDLIPPLAHVRSLVTLAAAAAGVEALALVAAKPDLTPLRRP